MNGRCRSPLAASLAILSALAACSTDVPAPVQPAVVRATNEQASVQQGNGPPLTPNGVPYRNPDYRHATGRAGLASLSARALLNRDGTTDLEITSGELDGAPPTDPIHKLQLKLFNPNNVQVRVENHNGLDAPYVEVVLPDAARHSAVQIQGNVEVPNVTGNNRTGVVTITERVNRRPDLAATAISGPARAVVNTSVNFLGTIAELNDDLGARGNCVYYVQGAEAARTNGIWVAEGDAVNCAMSHTFNAVGTYTVTMAVEDVSPGDWDLANNSHSVQIEIYQPEHFLHGTASAQQYDEYYQFDSDGQEQHLSSPSTYYYNYTTRNDRHESRAWFYGYSPNPLTFPANIFVRQSSGGATHDQINMAGPATGSCLNAWSVNSVASLCSSGGATWVNVSRYSGTVVYYTYDYNGGQNCYWVSTGWFGSGFWNCAPYGPNTINYYYNVTHNGGGFQALANDYRFEVRGDGAGGEIFKADVSVPLTTPFSGQSGTPFSCSSGSSNGWSWQNCHQSLYTWSGKSGSAPF